MTQVWMVSNSDTDIHLFNRYEHLEPSVRISYSRCQDVQIETEREGNKVVFVVTGKRAGKTFHENVIARMFPVWTDACHL